MNNNIIELLEKNKFITIENIIDKDFQDKIENVLCEKNFEWYFNESTISTSTYTLPDTYNKKNLQKYNLKDYLQFSHSFFTSKTDNELEVNSKYADIIYFILEQFYKKTNFKKTNILRAKANLQTQHAFNTENTICYPHTDLIVPHYVLIYYVNNSDGDTLFFDKELNITNRIAPDKGKILLFDGDLLHAGTNPKVSDKRIILNIDLQK